MPIAIISTLVSCAFVFIYASTSRIFIKGKSFSTVLIVLLSVLAVFLYFLLKSRTLIVASVLGCCFYDRKRIPQKAYPLLCVLFCALTFFLFLLRPESVYGRLLIWRTCLSMIEAKPLGFGLNGMQNNYMLFQARFFERHTTSPIAIYADDIVISYNEFLHCSVVLGVIGLLFFCSILVVLFLAKTDNGLNDILKSVLLVFVVFALFSFPFSHIVTWILFWTMVIAMRKPYFGVLINTLSIVLILLGMGEWCYKKHFEVVTEAFMTNQVDTHRIEQVIVNTNFYQLCPSLLEPLLKYEDFQHSRLYPCVVNHAVKRLPCTVSYCAMGDYLLNAGQINEALYYYRKASTMVPIKLMPKYKEFLLFFTRSDYTNALKVGTDILSMPIKVGSSDAILIVNDVKEKLGVISGYDAL